MSGTPANKVCKGYVFTVVCLSTWGSECLPLVPGECPLHPPWADTSLLRRSPGQTPPGRQPLSADTPLGRHPQADTSLGRPLGQTPLWADTLPCPVYAGIHTPLPSACWDMVNKQAVHITLQCILVYPVFQGTSIVSVNGVFQGVGTVPRLCSVTRCGSSICFILCFRALEQYPFFAPFQGTGAVSG